MNIFVLDQDPVIAAQKICDKHLVKMPLESTQLWSTIARRSGIKDGYEETHSTHPCCIWLQLSYRNRQWFHTYTNALFDEFEYRRNKQHSSRPIFERVSAKVLLNKENNFIPTIIKKPDALALKWYQKLYNDGVIELSQDKNGYKIEVKSIVHYFEDWYPAMPEHCRVDRDPVQSYINYYIKEKKDIVSYNWVPSRGSWYAEASV